MAGFFNGLKGEVSKLIHSVAQPCDMERQRRPQHAAGLPTGRTHTGCLTAGHFQLSEGVPLSLENPVPQTLAFEHHAQLMAVGSPEGHVHVVGREFEVLLRNPGTQLRYEFLIFPRPGLLLAMGAAPALNGWLAVWWNFQSANSAIPNRSEILSPQMAVLRFGVVCTAVADETVKLVFLGTDEGDVRIFDAGDTPGMGAYCIPGEKLRQEAVGQPCPVLALAAAPGGASELLIGTAEGHVVLWSFEHNKVSRTFGPMSGPVNSLAWLHQGVDANARSMFLAASASRGELFVFGRENGAAPILQVPLPGGPTSNIALLQWKILGDSAEVSEASPHPCGEVLLRRGDPAANVLRLWGPGWTQCEPLFCTDSDGSGQPKCITGAILCQSSPNGIGLPLACDATLLSTCEGSDGEYHSIFAALADTLAVLAVADHQIVARSLSPSYPKSWLATWGSIELASATALDLEPRPPRLLPGATSAKADVQSTDSNYETLETGRAEASSAAGIQNGELATDVQHLPEGHSSEPVDGWLICAAGEPLGSEEEVGYCTDEGIRWQLPPCMSFVTSTISLGLDARAVLIFWSETGEESIVFDSENQVVDWSSVFSCASTESQRSFEIDPGVEHVVVAKIEAASLSVEWNGIKLFEPLQLRGETLAVGWRCAEGELRIRDVIADPATALEGKEETELAAEEGLISSEQVATTDGGPADIVMDKDHEYEVVVEQDVGDFLEEMMAHRIKHFMNFMFDRGVNMESRPRIESWNSMVGGWQGTMCSGHRDGVIRIWLRAHSTVMLIHAISVRPLAPTAWRPQLDPSTFCFLNQQKRQNWYDGVDACPAVAVAGDSTSTDTTNVDWEVSAIAFDSAIRLLAAGTRSGRLVIFRWRSTPGPLPRSEMALKIEPTMTDGSSAISTDHQTDVSPSDEQQGSEAGALIAPAKQLVLPSGFVCVARLRKHQTRVTLLRLVTKNVDETACKEPVLRILSIDTTSNLCMADCLSGEVLAYISLNSSGQAPPESLNGAAPPPPPPVETLEAAVYSSQVLHIATPPLSTSTVTTPAAVAGAAAAAAIAAAGASGNATQGDGAFILALSSGELRQLKLPEMQLLDSRIQEFKLPHLPGGKILSLDITEGFLLAVQPASAHIILRRSAGSCKLTNPHQQTFAQRAIGAGIMEVHGELCLLVLATTLQASIFALPSLSQIATLNIATPVTPLLQGVPSADVTAVICKDGYIVLSVGQKESSRTLVKHVWCASCNSSLSSLDSAARTLLAAQVAHAAAHVRVLEIASSSEPENPVRQSKTGLFKGLFGSSSGTVAPKTLRECVAPALSFQLPVEVDAMSVDRARNLPVAWRDPRARPAPAAPSQRTTPTQSSETTRSSKTTIAQQAEQARQSLFSGYRGKGDTSTADPPSSATSSSASARTATSEIAQTHALAAERGDKVRQLADKSQKMMEDSNKFLDLAKQLNSKQQRSWF